MSHYGRRFTYDNADSAYGLYNGYAGQHTAPGAKRFRRDTYNGMLGNFSARGRNGMPENFFSHSSQGPYSTPYLAHQNQYAYGVQYGQQGDRNFSQQNVRHGFDVGQQDMLYPADQSMMFPGSRYGAVRQPFKPGYSRGLKRSKRGSHNGSRFTSESTSDLKAGILEKLAQRGGMKATELARMFSCEKKDINQVLYSMEKEGLVYKDLQDGPPRWALKIQSNVSASCSSGFSGQPKSLTKQRSCVPATCFHDNVAARSVVPLRVQTVSSEPTASNASESYDIIPAVAIRGSSVPSSAGIHTFAFSSCVSDPLKAAANAKNSRFSSAHIVDPVYQQDISYPSVSSSSICSATDVPAVNSVITSDIPIQKTFGSPSDSLQTAFGEQKKPAGRGRGVLLLNMTKERLANAKPSSVLAGCESKCDLMQLEADRFADDGRFDISIVPDFTRQPVSTRDANYPVGVDNINAVTLGQLTVNSKPSDHDREWTASCEVSCGTRADQSPGTFKPPLPPKQLIRADPTYKAAMPREANVQSKDDITLLLHGKHPGSSFAQNQGTDFAIDTESDSYKSLPESLSALSFHTSSIPSTRSLDDLHKSCIPSRSVDNPFASALGIEDSSSVSDLSSGQVAEGAGGLSLTSESFAALNKNSVSALMEYSQSRHFNIEIKCIGSFGPPHRPVYVFRILPIVFVILCILVCIFIETYRFVTTSSVFFWESEE